MYFIMKSILDVERLMYLYGQSDIEPYTGYNCHMYKDE